MLLLAADFDGRIVRGLRRVVSDLDLVRLQDTQLSGASDEAVLAWAATQGRVILTHDMSTLIGLAHERIESGVPMPGVIAVTSRTPIGTVIQDIQLLVLAMNMEEVVGQVLYVPLHASA